MITLAAIEFQGVIWVGKPKERHHDVIRQIVEVTGLKRVGFPQCQGFVDECGIFYNRNQALQHAIASGQVEVGKAKIRHVCDGKNLYSEDLW